MTKFAHHNLNGKTLSQIIADGYGDIPCYLASMDDDGLVTVSSSVSLEWSNHRTLSQVAVQKCSMLDEVIVWSKHKHLRYVLEILDDGYDCFIPVAYFSVLEMVSGARLVSGARIVDRLTGKIILKGE